MRLFDLDIPSNDEEKATAYISWLQEQDYVGVNMSYLTNYINADLSIALSHIRERYMAYVLKGEWTEEKFTDVLMVISRDRRMLVANTFLQYGVKYDEGKLKREVAIERRKYVPLSKQQKDKKETNANNDKNEISEEEQELLDYIAKHGGQ